MNDSLIACLECDLLQREVRLPRHGIARCRRCGATLYRGHPDSLERTLGLTAGAIVLFVIANAFPIVGVEIQGQLNQTTIFGAVRALYHNQMQAVAALVFITTIAMPAVEIFALTYLLLPLRLGRVPRYFGPVFRMLQSVQSWNMIEIFVLGVLVALIKLADVASIDVGIALWPLAALMLVMAAITSTLDARALWAKAAIGQ